MAGQHRFLKVGIAMDILIESTFTNRDAVVIIQLIPQRLTQRRQLCLARAAVDITVQPTGVETGGVIYSRMIRAQRLQARRLSRLHAGDQLMADTLVASRITKGVPILIKIAEIKMTMSIEKFQVMAGGYRIIH